MGHVQTGDAGHDEIYLWWFGGHDTTRKVGLDSPIKCDMDKHILQVTCDTVGHEWYDTISTNDGIRLVCDN